MRVAVLGGGYAGMAAAVTLAERGVPVTVYEAAAHLGGRARRVDYRGTILDNGLHVLIGACSEMLRLIALVDGAPESALVRLPLDWRMHGVFRLRVPALPAPFHLAAALLTARGVTLGARVAALRFVRALRARAYRLDKDMSVADLLAAYRQDAAMIRYLWRPLCVSALNTPIELASAQIFMRVLREALDTAARSSDLLVARRDLTALFPEPAARYVRDRGGEILLAHTVSSVGHDSGTYTVAAREARRQYTHVVCALPPHRLLPVVSRLTRLQELAATVARFEYQPIHSVYLQYRERVRLPGPMVGIPNGLAHWLFDREAICGQTGLVAAVISAAGPHQRLTQDELALQMHAEIAKHFGPLPELLWHRVIAEKRASFASTVGIQRPGCRTALSAFHLAGDYVASDYPATLESAVRSGVQAAHAILNQAH
ncbi:MAG TPA: hydroxysqualene dehydroxylase HpnE [Burkholderiales bacterium]|nr:hydroxysqualene dehydroxylase HpnE [Burkholderiales bacterium]